MRFAVFDQVDQEVAFDKDAVRFLVYDEVVACGLACGLRSLTRMRSCMRFAEFALGVQDGRLARVLVSPPWGPVL